MAAYYNEHDLFAAAWLRELIKAGLIADGEVDERSITEVQPDDLRSFVQCHFFAGIGGWSYALRLAGWPDDRAVWTGSCPCQPWSVAGKNRRHDDPRHLWPTWYHLIAECYPSVIFGEQVAGAAGSVWLDGVCTDLESRAYAVGAADLAAGSVSAPHKRQRLYFVADACRARRQQNSSGTLGDEGADGRQSNGDHVIAGDGESDHARLADADSSHGFWWSGPLQVGRNAIEAEIERSGRRYRAQWRTQPGLSLLAHGVPNRVEQLCGFGNAIVPQLAAEFIAAYAEITSIP